VNCTDAGLKNTGGYRCPTSLLLRAVIVAVQFEPNTRASAMNTVANDIGNTTRSVAPIRHVMTASIRVDSGADCVGPSWRPIPSVLRVRHASLSQRQSITLFQSSGAAIDGLGTTWKACAPAVTAGSRYSKAAVGDRGGT